jgi:hypothetical protein
VKEKRAGATKHELNRAAQVLGRKGGQAKSERKTLAVRANALKAGRSRRVCAECGEPVARSWHRNAALDQTCPGRTSKWEKPSERRKRLGQS